MMKIFNFSGSMIEDLICPAYYVPRHVYHLDGKGNPPYGPMGTAVHLALQDHYSGKGIEAVLDTLDLQYKKIIPAGTLPMKDNGKTIDEMMKQNVFDNVEVFCQQHPYHSLPFKVLELEKRIGIDMGNGYIYWMKQDMLIQEGTTGMPVVWDNKTRWGKINYWWLAKFAKCAQFSGYIWGARQRAKKTGMILAPKVYVNVLSMQALPRSTRKCTIHGVTYSECAREHVEYELHTYGRTEADLKAWRNNIMALAMEAKAYREIYGKDIRLLKHVPRFGAFRDACMFCSMKKWCDQDFDPAFKDELTEEYIWKPWEEGGRELIKET
jgi:hypothetical protein